MAIKSTDTMHMHISPCFTTATHEKRGWLARLDGFFGGEEEAEEEEEARRSLASAASTPNPAPSSGTHHRGLLAAARRRWERSRVGRVRVRSWRGVRCSLIQVRRGLCAGDCWSSLRLARSSLWAFFFFSLIAGLAPPRHWLCASGEAFKDSRREIKNGATMRSRGKF